MDVKEVKNLPTFINGLNLAVDSDHEIRKFIEWTGISSTFDIPSEKWDQQAIENALRPVLEPRKTSTLRVDPKLEGEEERKIAGEHYLLGQMIRLACLLVWKVERQAFIPRAYDPNRPPKEKATSRLLKSRTFKLKKSIEETQKTFTSEKTKFFDPAEMETEAIIKRYKNRLRLLAAAIGLQRDEREKIEKIKEAEVAKGKEAPFEPIRDSLKGYVDKDLDLLFDFLRRKGGKSTEQSGSASGTV